MKQKLVLTFLLTGMFVMTGCGTPDAQDTSTVESEVAVTGDTSETKAPETEVVTETAPEENADKTTDSSNHDFSSNVQISYEFAEDDTEDDNGNIILYSSYSHPTVTVLDNPEATDLINKVLLKEKTDFEKDLETIVGAAKEYQEQVKKYDSGNEYDTEQESTTDNAYGYYKSYSTGRFDNQIISLIATNTSYMGGAHGSNLLSGLTFDSNTGERLALTDLSDEPDALLAAIKEDIIAQCSGKQSEKGFFEDPSSEAFAKSLDGILKTDSWYFTKAGICIVGNEYELAPYAAGAFYFTIPYEKLTMLKKEYQYHGGYVLPVSYGNSVQKDLDGDGTDEDILFEISYAEEDDYMPVLSLNISGTDCTDVLTNNDIPLPENPETNYYLVDLDSSDSFVEFALSDNGMSDDPVTYFFRYDKGSILSLGYVNASLSGKDCVTYGDGTLTAMTHTTLLESAYAPADYMLSGDKIVPAEQEWYYPDRTFFPEERLSHAILKDFTVYTANSTDANKKVLTAADGPVSFPALDNDHWVQVKTSDGNIYYMYMSDFSTIDSDGTMLSIEDVFENLYLVD